MWWLKSIPPPSPPLPSSPSSLMLSDTDTCNIVNTSAPRVEAQIFRVSALHDPNAFCTSCWPRRSDVMLALGRSSTDAPWWGRDHQLNHRIWWNNHQNCCSLTSSADAPVACYDWKIWTEVIGGPRANVMLNSVKANGKKKPSGWKLAAALNGRPGKIWQTPSPWTPRTSRLPRFEDTTRVEPVLGVFAATMNDSHATVQWSTHFGGHCRFMKPISFCFSLQFRGHSPTYTALDFKI